VALYGDSEIRVYSIGNDRMLTLRSVGFAIDLVRLSAVRILHI